MLINAFFYLLFAGLFLIFILLVMYFSYSLLAKWRAEDKIEEYEKMRKDKLKSQI